MSGVSVVIPAYNQPQMLAETLRSVQEQTSPPSEVIVVDDASQPPLEGEVGSALGMPVRFLRHETNTGPAASVVEGMRHSRFQLVTTLNHDDVWEPRFLERLVGELAAHPQACFAFCEHGIMRAGGEHDEALSLEQSRRFGRSELAEGLLSGRELYEAALLKRAVASSSFALFRREALQLELIAAGEDMWDYFLTVGACMTGDAAVYVAERLGWYRFSPTMLSTTWAEPAKQIRLARPQTAIIVLMLRFERFRALRGKLSRRLMLTLRHALAAALRTRRPRSGLLVGVRVTQGLCDAHRLGTSKRATRRR